MKLHDDVFAQVSKRTKLILSVFVIGSFPAMLILGSAKFPLWIGLYALLVLAYLWRTGALRRRFLIIGSLIILCVLSGYGYHLTIGRSPVITIIRPADGFSVQAASTTLAGSVAPKDSSIIVNGSAVAVDAAGRFTTILPLLSGQNFVLITADHNGLQETKSLSVTRPYSEEEQAALQKAKDEADAEAKAEEAAYRNSPAGRLCAKHPDWTPDDCERVAKNEYWIGMRSDMLKAERGLPDYNHPSNYGNGVEYQWCWTDYTPSCFYAGSDEIITSYN